MKLYIPRQERLLSAQEYLREMADSRHKNNIESVRFIPPRLGEPGYGGFRVRYKTPVLCEE